MQRRDLGLFLEFMREVEGTLKRERWTPRLTKAFVEWLRKFTHADGQRRWNDKTINRIVVHLKTFAKWVHRLRAFPLGDPTAKIKSLPVGTRLDIERALTKSERRHLLDTADQLPVLGGRSRDRSRFKGQLKKSALPDGKPKPQIDISSKDMVFELNLGIRLRGDTTA